MNPSQLFATLLRRMEAIADRRSRRKTGVTPGGPYGAVFVDDAGHVVRASAGGLKLRLIATGNETEETLTLPQIDVTRRVQWGAGLYDPDGLVTTGSSWRVTVDVTARYFVIAQSGSSTVTWLSGDTMALTCNAGSFYDQFYQTLPDDDSGAALFTLQTSGIVYRTAGQEIYFEHEITNSMSGSFSHGGRQLIVFQVI